MLSMVCGGAANLEHAGISSLEQLDALAAVAID
jgi:hypothetical protein